MLSKIPEDEKGDVTLGHKFMIALVVQYVITAGVFAYEGNYPKMVYWAGAALITSSVLWMD